MNRLERNLHFNLRASSCRDREQRAAPSGVAGLQREQLGEQSESLFGIERVVGDVKPMAAVLDRNEGPGRLSLGGDNAQPIFSQWKGGPGAGDDKPLPDVIFRGFDIAGEEGHDVKKGTTGEIEFIGLSLPRLFRADTS